MTTSNPAETYLVENPLCPTIARYVYPKQYPNKDNEVKWIVSKPGTSYVQAVRVETCVNAGKSCKVNSDFDLGEDFDIETVCKQKYTTRRLLAVSTESGSEEVDTFKFPTSCACYQIEKTPFRKNKKTYLLRSIGLLF